MQLVDAALLMSIIGLPERYISKVLQQELNIYHRATSNEGLLCIKKYWDSHCSTFSKLPAVVLLDQSSCPKGLSDKDFVNLISRLTDLQQWQIWDLQDTLDIHGCGFVGCPEFTLAVVLLCAAVSQQQLQVLHAYQQHIHKVFTGSHVGSKFAGLSQCCQLLGVPIASLVASMKQLDMLQTVIVSSNNNCCCSNSNSNGRNLHCCKMSCCCSCPTAEEGATSQSGCYCPESITEVTSATTWDTQKATDNLLSQHTMCGSPSSCTGQADAGGATAAVAVAPGSKRTACFCSSISSCNWQIKQPRSCTPRTHQEEIHPVQQAPSMQDMRLVIFSAICRAQSIKSGNIDRSGMTASLRTSSQQAEAGCSHPAQTQLSNPCPGCRIS